ncbi:helix-turn-helix domain-containing protein [Natrinema sp. SYSU A 869]|uniref:helix-turn-helix domain-containing protein n=1 Tax=Natrinema sp. SYSU A 869 TaxID=2871694 RepID=UPI002104D5CD|nr:helix-turn-helix domain-containing protein [Natrinema sp. SYSU A 869]
MNSRDDFDVELSPRGIVLLKIRMDNPTAPVREIRDILADQYGIELSHNRVNELLHDMSDKDVFRKSIQPNKRIFDYHSFRIAFHYPNFEDQWEECYLELVEDPHVVMFCNADSNYHWQLLMQFNGDREAEQWMHHFFKKHGSLIAQFDNTKLPTVHKFDTHSSVFDEKLWQTEEGREYCRTHERSTATKRPLPLMGAAIRSRRLPPLDVVVSK